jgi:hypothetical protein
LHCLCLAILPLSFLSCYPCLCLVLIVGRLYFVPCICSCLLGFFVVALSFASLSWPSCLVHPCPGSVSLVFLVVVCCLSVVGCVSSLASVVALSFVFGVSFVLSWHACLMLSSDILVCHGVWFEWRSDGGGSRWSLLACLVVGLVSCFVLPCFLLSFI